MKEVINKLFEPCYHYKLGTYRGKHILEDELKRYVSEKEFIDIMIEYGFVYKHGKLKARHIVQMCDKCYFIEMFVDEFGNKIYLHYKKDKTGKLYLWKVDFTSA